MVTRPATRRRTAPNFNIGVVSMARVDGTGEVIEGPIVPASIIMLNMMRAKSELARSAPGFFQAYVSLAIGGQLAEAGVEVPDLTDPSAIDEAALSFYGEWATDVEIPGGDDDAEGEEGPTTAS